jgi:hypothetical protein
MGPAFDHVTGEIEVSRGFAHTDILPYCSIASGER